MKRQVELQYFVTMDAHHRAYCHNQTHPLLETVLPSANKLHHVHHLLLVRTKSNQKNSQNNHNFIKLDFFIFIPKHCIGKNCHIP